MSSMDIAGINWSAGRLLPVFQTPKQLTIYDLRGASNEVQLSAATMAGLINRPEPMVYQIFTDEDAFWLKELLGGIPQETSPTSGDGVLDGMLIPFRNVVKGMIIYDPNFVDSINIATTMAGQTDCIVVSPQQAADLQQAFNLPVHTDLHNQHWSSRSQAYDWARQNLLSGASSHAVAGFNPMTAGLRSFLVANRIFVYWLDSRGSEQSLIEQIYKVFPAEAVHLGWFIDEPGGVKLTSNAALPVLATDLSTNLEVWAGVSAPSSIAQSNPIGPAGPIDSSRVYISFTISDGDNLQYIQHRMLHLWQDPARGSFPLGWTISPVLSQAAPAMAAYFARSATADDELIAGPSGAGYMYPSYWPQAQLASFLQRTEELMRSMNLTTLEVLDESDGDTRGTSILDTLRQAISSLIGLASTGSLLEILQQVLPALEASIPGLRGSQLFSNAALQTRYTQALAPIGLNGILSGAGVKIPGVTYGSGGIPIFYNLGLADSVQSTVNLVKSATFILKQRPLFLNVYLLAWKMGPSDIKQVIQQLGSGYEVVKPGLLLKMIEQVHSKGH
jgi:GxGYxYP putative glycoside hydrolase C-terminal domain/GxGYxYP_N second domain/GxGYxYP third domain/GxGYxYP_N 1st domain